MSSEPVHEALVAARMQDLRHGRSKSFEGRAAGATVTDRVAAPAPWPSSARSVVHGLRLRIGRALVAFGTTIQGPCDCPEGTASAGT
jgi:hypothetical protein